MAVKRRHPLANRPCLAPPTRDSHTDEQLSGIFISIIDRERQKNFVGRSAAFECVSCGDLEEKKDAHQPAALTHHPTVSKFLSTSEVVSFANNMTILAAEHRDVGICQLVCTVSN